MALGDNVQYAGQYKLRECNLLSSTGILARLDANVIEVNIFENIFSQSVIVNLLVIDQNNLIANMPIMGQEYVTIKLETPGVGSIDYTDNVLCVQKVTARKGLSVGSEVYEINLVSPESLRNNRTRVSKSFVGTDSDIVIKILKDEKIINTRKEIHIDETSRIRKYVAPNVRPNDFISFLTREATSKKYDNSPHYFFYENTRGFNFRVLDSLYKEPTRGDFVAAENILVDNNTHQDLNKDYRRVMKHSIVSSNDTLFTTRGGMLSSKLLRYNIFQKKYDEYTFNYFDNFDDYSRIDKNPIYNKVPIDNQGNTLGDFFDARVHLHPTSNNGTNDAQYDDSSVYSYSDNHSEEWLLQRRSKMTEINSGALQVQLKVHGYCSLAVGDKINLSLPISGFDHEGVKDDKFYKGEFLITQLRHTFSQDERIHTMLMNVVKDSIPETFNNKGSSVEPTCSEGQVITH